MSVSLRSLCRDGWAHTSPLFCELYHVHAPGSYVRGFWDELNSIQNAFFWRWARLKKKEAYQVFCRPRFRLVVAQKLTFIERFGLIFNGSFCRLIPYLICYDPQTLGAECSLVVITGVGVKDHLHIFKSLTSAENNRILPTPLEK